METPLTQIWIAEIRHWTGSLFPGCELSFPVPNLCNPYSGSVTLTAFWFRVSPGPAPSLMFIGVPHGRVTALYPAPRDIRIGFAPWVTIDRSSLLQQLAQSQVQVEPFFDDRFFRSLPESGRLGIMSTPQNHYNPSQQTVQFFKLYDQCLQQYLGTTAPQTKTLIAFYQQFVRQTPPGLFLYYRRINMAFWDWVETGISSIPSAVQEEAVGLS